MENTKTLIDLDGTTNTIFFNGTNAQIYSWVLDNFGKLSLREALSCSATLNGHAIEIRGDKDYKQFLISEPNVIDLNDSTCGCDKQEKKNCSNILCIEKRAK